jgi:hippurate hydrolase
MGSEDFGLFGLPGRKIPALFLRVGATDPAKLSESQRTGVSVHGLHSAFFAPVPSPTIRTGVIALTAAVIELLKR